MKYRVGSGSWNHATLDANASHDIAPTGSTISPTTDGKGVLVYRSADGSGTTNFTGIEIRWNYGADGVADTAVASVQVFGIEMVYVPQGSFYVGDGTTTDVEAQFHQGGSVTTPFQITSEGSFTLGGTDPSNMGNNNNQNDNSGAFTMTPDDFDNTTTQTLPASYPKGYNAFYCMKYEVTQDQYASFLNTLDGTQQADRVSAVSQGSYMAKDDAQNAPVNRNGIRCKTAPVGSTPGEYGNDLNNNGVYGESDDGMDIACNFISWADGAAYLDWSGLRPMSELEFEKACRGTLVPFTNEFAWGDTAIARSYYGLSTAGTSTEDVASNYATTMGNASYGFTVFPVQNVPDFNDYGPLRVGIFAGNAGNTGRLTSGASYYGIMELTGNVVERTITVGNTTGRNFTATHGDGVLTSGGDANVGGWPGTDAFGAGRRGGRWSSNVGYDGKRISDRAGANLFAANRDYLYGIRGVRTSPN
ncbi:MAG TPA: SUMF1/EgtB/PvdO family nonheme iron enzyme [Bacteroidota bacterium]|nr:SUMF1/EgtB/PvdO family nonheme iron enzyme [Bacteroidota bacterium]